MSTCKYNTPIVKKTMLSIAGLASIAILYKGAKYIKNKFFTKRVEEIEVVEIKDEDQSSEQKEETVDESSA